MTKFFVEIQCDNAAFNGNEMESPSEVARILREVADKLDAGYAALPLRDINGNHVGRAWFATDEMKVR